MGHQSNPHGYHNSQDMMKRADSRSNRRPARLVVHPQRNGLKQLSACGLEWLEDGTHTEVREISEAAHHTTHAQLWEQMWNVASQDHRANGSLQICAGSKTLHREHYTGFSVSGKYKKV